ncbi:MAG: hypothetical protein ACRDHM_03280 [Actinomycetota bacterium]
MARRPSKRDLSTGILVVLLAGVLVSQALQAGATHQPANKAAAGSEIIVKVPPAQEAGAGDSDNTIIGPLTLRTSKPTDLMFHVSLECSILTQVTSQSGQALATAEGEIRVWLVIDGTNIVGLNDSSDPPQNPGPYGSDTDKVTFCNREHQLEQTDNESGDGLDTTRSYIETKDANAFNWIDLNLGSGLHTIEVRADLKTTVNGGGTASGFVGNRTLLVTPEKLANDATV